MSNAELKLKLVRLISDFEDRDLLEEIFDLLSNAGRTSQNDWWDGLTDAHLARLEASVQDFESGKTLSHDEVKANMEKWLSE